MAKKPNTLSVRWSRAREHGDTTIAGQRFHGDLLYEWGDGCHKADCALMHYALGCEHPTIDRTWAPSLLKKLHDRGYDITTLRFSIKKRKPVGEAEAGKDA